MTSNRNLEDLEVADLVRFKRVRKQTTFIENHDMLSVECV